MPPDDSTFWGLVLWPDDLEGGSSEELFLSWPDPGTQTFIKLTAVEDTSPFKSATVHLSLAHARDLAVELRRRVEDERVRRREQARKEPQG